MIRLSDEQERERERLAAAVAAARSRLEAAVDAYNRGLEGVKDVLAELNGTLAEARDFVDGVRSDQDAYFDEKSERWRAGGAGQAYDAWRDEFDAGTSALEDVELVDAPPGDLEAPEVEAETYLADLPEAP